MHLGLNRQSGFFIYHLAGVVSCIRVLMSQYKAKHDQCCVCVSVGQGIIGNDSRHYILDLLRTFPPDVNFLPGVIGVNSGVCITAFSQPY